MDICENCNIEHGGHYGSGRFCSSKCARSFSTKDKRIEINKKVSEKMKGRKMGFSNLSTKECNRLRKIGNAALREKYDIIYKNSSWEELSYENRRRRLLEEQNGNCLICGISSWNEKPISLRFDHIDGVRENNVRENCRMICPNCDSQLDTYCGRNKRNRNKKYTDEKLFALLKQNDFVINRVLEEIGFAKSKSIYNRLNSIIEKFK